MGNKTFALQLVIEGPALEQPLPVSVSVLPSSPASGLGPQADATSPIQLTAPGRFEIPLPEAQTFVVHPTSPGYWGERVEVRRSTASGPIVVRLFPEARISGEVALPTGAEAEALRVGIRWPAAGADGRTEPRLAVEESCPLLPPENGTRYRFRCALPATTVDLRLSADELIPHYLWSVNLEPAQEGSNRTIDLGSFKMTWGASVSGWVTADVEPVPTAAGQKAATATVRLTPVAQGTTAASSGLAAKAYEVPAEPSGFFQLQGVETGEYELSATFPGLSTARVPSLLVQAREETRLPSTLVVPKPTRLTVQVEPEADPWGRPWQLRLLRAHPSAHYLETVAEATSSAQGWTSTALEPGTHQLRVFDETGATWWNHPVEVRGGEQEEWIEIPVIEVVGAVRRGGDPVAGELIFGTTQGKERLTFALDEDGRFEGYLPREGTWPLELRPLGGQGVRTLEPVEVEVPQGELIAELDIELPDTLLYGEVVDENGDALANAHLTLIGLRPERKRREALDQADDEGRFEIAGLAPGDVLIQAAHEGGKSPWRQISLQEGLDPGSLRLVVEREAEISGRIVAQGRGLAGALVLAQPDPHQGLSASQRRAVSAAGGGFRLQVPARPLSLLVWAPGHPLRLLRHSPSTESTEPLELDLSTASGELVLAPAAALSGNLDWNQLTLLHRGAQVSFLVLMRDLQLPLDKELRLSIPQAQPGGYVLCATGPTTCARGVLAPGGQLLLELAPAAQAAISSQEPL